MKQLHLYTDGGARGNPGPAGIGIYVCEGKTVVLEHAEYLGTHTNNWAEYQGLLRGLEEIVRQYGAKLHDIQVQVHMDSELIIKQMKGEYRVKDAELKKQYSKVRALIETAIPHISFAHVRREQNSIADRLANEAMDKAGE